MTDDVCDKVCLACGHPLDRHGPEGCEVERGDSYESGYAPMALGPCACQESAHD